MCNREISSRRIDCFFPRSSTTIRGRSPGGVVPTPPDRPRYEKCPDRARVKALFRPQMTGGRIFQLRSIIVSALQVTNAKNDHLFSKSFLVITFLAICYIEIILISCVSIFIVFTSFSPPFTGLLYLLSANNKYNNTIQIQNKLTRDCDRHCPDSARFTIAVSP